MTLQNPVVSLVWPFGNLQLLAPAAGMANDTRFFCQPMIRTKLSLFLSIPMTTAAFASILVSNYVVNLCTCATFLSPFAYSLAPSV